MLNDKTKGRLLVMAGALMWSSSGVFTSAPVFDVWSEEVRGPLLAFWRAAFAALVLAPTVRRPKFHPLLIPLTLCFAVMNLTYLTAMVRTSPANACWLQNAAPFWVLLITVFLFREPVRSRNLIPLLFGLTGVCVILVFEMRQTGTSYDPLGLFCGVLGGITYAGVLSLMNRVSQLEAAWVVALNHTVAAIALLPWAIATGIHPTLPQLLILAAFGAFQIGIPYCLVVRGLRSISAQEAVGIGLIEPVVMPIWVYLAWGVGTNWWTILGAVFIVGGLALRYFVLGDVEENQDAALPPSPSGRGPG